MKKIGVLGGGQLARMLALAGYPLGIEIYCYESVPDTCAAQVTQVMRGDFQDQDALMCFAQQVDCVTFETENLPLACAETIARTVPLLPNLEALRLTQDRLLEKRLLRSLGIPTTHFYGISSLADLENGLSQSGFPAILKTRRQGYDGKGQVLITDRESAVHAFKQLHQYETILEAFVPFTKEVSLISVRSSCGEIKFYPLITNQHESGILRVSRAPCVDARLQKMAEGYAAKLIQKLDYVGLMTIEFFVVNDELIANEIAPRVHNSGHWTIEGAVTSQFENHLRAIAGLQLGATEAVGHSVMCNLIGNEPTLASILRIPHTHYHTYGKSPRLGRKLGHITVNHADSTEAQSLADRVLELIS